MASETILHARISEKSYNVKLAIETDDYVVTYGKQRECYQLTPQGLIQATQEYIECVEHCKRLESMG